MLITLFYFFIAVVFIQLFYYLGIFGKFAFAKPQEVTPKNIPVSVIVCAKNEEENVKKFVPLLAEQNYPDFEIVLIDDASSDETLEVFEEFEQKYPNIRLVKVENNEAFWGNKKYALTLGIKAAKKEYLLFTDADCYPTSKDWITSMTSQFTESKTIVLGYGGYEKRERSFLNKIIRFETVLTAVQYFSWAKAGLPYMGVGRNLAYKKEEFFNVNGFIDHIQVRSGDDDLFINQAANKSNTTISYNPESFTYSNPKESFKDWFTQKRRHISTAEHYKFFDKFQLGLFFCSQLFFFLSVIVLLAFQFQWIAVVAILATRYTVVWTVIGFSAGKLKEKDIKIWFPIVEIALILTQINIFITNIFSKPVYWK
ncbi:glycosyltransferase [Flavobacterium johnsoniae]|jgi:glycosyltransferase involved in cell wall biosynthesis|uniref:Glycosyltransferase, catalytic subunit of cellulose synthase and poly-beta-1,6-N-acetylglucosamine synthase n=2 Tax=Flavobacterium johnsoniae TaxID=986 RepID=A0A1M7DM90_FLAJO|nr:glycosyltransferase [Flavobacterium johnsoniae]ABQ03258.1 Candidate beta-glycosyltransferase; Glycosyltransferase family 2 [Flavobacterium johnsoniae UW101]OXG01319.1 glycosyl transferase family 2 [Flavobacterium johnsoniae UW101]WQG79877.1 glycosyltransferase [Flavobacterium johnsoniae UW101]SHG55990.1 Glycosyltransferase, catalytic subunit of cellulose synthase and poly-beta-1,6-N-acetylglucosamine synthase [Flavobacterium johnsoniae]SHL80626.1 Glycosyltransferase, catalytic subunit of ce